MYLWTKKEVMAWFYKLLKLLKIPMTCVRYYMEHYINYSFFLGWVLWTLSRITFIYTTLGLEGYILSLFLWSTNTSTIRMVKSLFLAPRNTLLAVKKGFRCLFLRVFPGLDHLSGVNRDIMMGCLSSLLPIILYLHYLLPPPSYPAV